MSVHHLTVIVEPGRLESALSRFKKKFAATVAELRRRQAYVPPSAKRRAKRERHAARLRRQARRLAESGLPD